MAKAAVTAPAAPRTIQSSGSALGFIILLCFFFSGASGLIYEIVWTRLLELLFGATTYAVSALLTAFMSGLALGSVIGGRFADRVRRPLFAYGLLELGIGLYALAFPAIYQLLHAVYLAAGPILTSSLYISILCRFVMALCTLIVPTTLMGATLPFLSKFVTAEESRIGVNVGRLYGINTVGAVTGVLLSGFVLLPMIGQQKSILTAAVTNLVLGVVCCALGKNRETIIVMDAASSPERRPKRRLPEEEAVPEGDRTALTRVRFALFVAFASGFAALVYEVCWTRVLVMVLGGSVYAFSTMLATFLIGLSLGALIISSEVDHWGKRGPVMLAALQGVTGVVVVLTGFFFERLPYAFMYMFKLVPQLALVKWLQTHAALNAQETANLTIRFLLSGVVMLPAALLIGGTFPAVLRLASSDLKRLGRSVGTVYSINTLGAIVGSFSAGFLLIPTIGIQNSLYVGVFANLASMLVALIMARSDNIVTRGAMALACAVLIVLGLTRIPRWKPQLIASGVYFHALYATGDYNPHSIVKDRLESYKLLHYKEGAVSTVTVEEYVPNGHLLLANNGKIDASSHVDMPTQELVAHLPILWYQCARGKAPTPPRDVVLIGLASGVTAGSALQHDIKELHNVEIEPSMPQATKFFNNLNHRPLDDKRLQLYVNDARDFLTLAPKKFDVIISEPSNPWVSGVSNLFTEDCFRIGKAALKDDGIYCQWVQFYSLNVRDVKVLMRTFNKVFENVYVFGVPPNIGEESPGPDLIVLGSRHPLRLDVAALRKAMRDQRLVRDLGRVNVNSPGDLVALLRMGPQETRRYHTETRRERGAGLFNTDDNMHIEYAAPRSLYDETYSSNFDEITKFQADPTDQRYLDQRNDRPEQARQLLDHIVARMILMDAKELAVKVRKKMEAIP